MELMVIAGASFPAGVLELGDVARRHGFMPLYLDHEHHAARIEKGLPSLRFAVGLPEDVSQQSGLFLPMLESWVSEARKVSPRSKLRCDREAAFISRSKLKLSLKLAQAGVASVERSQVETLEQALEAAGKYGYPAVLRGDTGYSGRGVWIADSPAQLQTYWRMLFEERATADFVEMRNIMDSTDVKVVVEPWLGGDEWSIDCITGPAGVQLIRVCQKATAIVAGRPISLGYHLIASTDLLAELRRVVPSWISAIFHSDTISFACFDVRRHPNGQLVPLDFAARLGGDNIPLLVRRASLNGNPYAAALDSVLAADPSRMASVQTSFAIIHAFAITPGIFSGISLSLPAEIIDIRPRGFRIERGRRNAVFRRVGTVLTQFQSNAAFVDACRRAAEWIHVQCD